MDKTVIQAASASFALTTRRLAPRALVPAILAALVAMALIETLIVRPRPRLLWNISPSSPTGFYVVTKARLVQIGDMVVAWPPPAARRLADQRHYLPATVPLVKRVGAAAGDRVCAKGSRVSVNGRIAAFRRRIDPAGRALPRWTGCRLLGKGDFLLLSPHSPLAFDGRYFGVTRVRDVIGKGRLVWAS